VILPSAVHVAGGEGLSAHNGPPVGVGDRRRQFAVPRPAPDPELTHGDVHRSPRRQVIEVPVPVGLSRKQQPPAVAEVSEAAEVTLVVEVCESPAEVPQEPLRAIHIGHDSAGQSR